MRAVLVAAILVLGSAAPARAQELASTFDQLRVLIKAGDTLTIAGRDGQETRGRMVRLTRTSLEIDVDGATRLLQEDAITTIRRRHADSLANGAKIGFGVGAGFGTLVAIAVVGEIGSAAAIPMVLVYGAMGAGIGVGIDGVQSSDQVIFSRPGPVSARLGISPIASQGRRGARLTLRF
jgi:hypothetical protein